MARVLGIDLASRKPGTAACVLDGVRVERLLVNLDDDALLELARDPMTSKIAIDAPFGWPMSFLKALRAHADGEPWPVLTGDPDLRAELVRRKTDEMVWRATAAGERRGKTALSVSADKIAHCAMRCAALLTAIGHERGTDAVVRAGNGVCLEVYPAAALQEWGVIDGGGESYKSGPAAATERARIVDGLSAVVELKQEDVKRCRASHDVLDALVCALVARAAHLGLTAPPPPKLAPLAAVEGWIHLPRRASLSELGTAAGMEREENQSQDVDPERAAGLEAATQTSGDIDATPVTGNPADVSQVDSASEAFADEAE